MCCILCWWAPVCFCVVDGESNVLSGVVDVTSVNRKINADMLRLQEFADEQDLDAA